jgi:hypothetical protein
MAHHLILTNTLCLSLTRSHCLLISIHPPLSHIAVVAVVAAALLSPLPLPLPPHKLSPLPPTPLPPSPLRRLLPLPSPVGCCLSRVPIYPSTYQSDEEDNNAADAADAVEGLLGMAATELLSADNLEENGVEEDVDEDDNEYGW